VLINFNIEKLDKLLYDFYSLTGLTISIWDADFNQLGFQPKDMQSFCRLIKETGEGKHRCLVSDKIICEKCKSEMKPVTHRCHAGLVDTAVPIKYKDEILGYLIFGQVREREKENNDEDIDRLARELKINSELLKSLYGELSTYDRAKIESAANIIKMSARYLWLSEYIDIGYDLTATAIDSYIRENVTADLSLRALCARFRISKNKIYAISQRWFKMTIGEYVRYVRIDEAKKLLTATDMPISDISDAVGINDYNYFTKYFKRTTGLTPSNYRKSFPFNLHQ
jgi:AraC-like DNA-binding protein